MPGHHVRVDLTQLATTVTEIRDVAETVRTYGTAGELSIASRTPTALHMLAAQLESEMRGWAHTQRAVTRMFDGRQGPEAIRFPELRAVLTYATPAPISRDVQKAELRAAATYLQTLARGLATAMVTLSAPKFVSLMNTEAATIAEFAGALD